MSDPHPYNNQPQGVDVGRMASIIADRWLVVLGCMVLVAGSAFAYLQLVAKPVFQATALVSYAPAGQSNPTGGALPSTGVTRENINTLVGVAGRAQVVQKAATTAGVSVDKLRKSAVVRPHGDASIIEFSAKAGTAPRSAELANAWSKAFVADRRAAVVRSIQGQLAPEQKQLASLLKLKLTPEDPRNLTINNLTTQINGRQNDLAQWSDALQVSSEAEAPLDNIWPKKTLTMFAAVLIGFALGCGVALLTARVDRRLQGDEWDELPASVVVRVPRSRSAPQNAPLGPDRADPLVGDAFAALGARIILDRVGDGAHVVLVTSARSGEGKSTVASNLASALAQGGRRVVLLDADMRKPTQAQVFPALQGRPGLSQILVGATQVENALTLVAPNLAAIASGPRQSNASTLLASVSFRTLIERLTNICELVVIDAPPVLAVQDALAMAPAANQALLCARVGSSHAEELEETHARLAGAAPRISQSVVLLGTERPTGYGYDGEDLWPANGGLSNTAHPAAAVFSAQVGSSASAGVPPTPGEGGDGAGAVA